MLRIASLVVTTNCAHTHNAKMAALPQAMLRNDKVATLDLAFCTQFLGISFAHVGARVHRILHY